MSDTTDRTENQDLVTEEDDKVAKEKYLANPDQCPYCASTNTDITDYDLDERPLQKDMYERLIECGECHNEWKETIKIEVVDVDLLGRLA